MITASADKARADADKAAADAEKARTDARKSAIDVTKAETEAGKAQSELDEYNSPSAKAARLATSAKSVAQANADAAEARRKTLTDHSGGRRSRGRQLQAEFRADRSMVRRGRVGRGGRFVLDRVGVDVTDW